MNNYYNIPLNSKDKAIIDKVDPNKIWENNDCSDKTLLKILGRPKDVIKKVQFIDHNGLADRIKIIFTNK
jgi:hypothetical protein